MMFASSLCSEKMIEPQRHKGTKNECHAGLDPASINAAAYMDSGSEAGMTATFFPSVPLCLCGKKTAQPA